jgi:hypothetical protein
MVDLIEAGVSWNYLAVVYYFGWQPSMNLTANGDGWTFPYYETTCAVPKAKVSGNFSIVVGYWYCESGCEVNLECGNSPFNAMDLNLSFYEDTLEEVLQDAPTVHVTFGEAWKHQLLNEPSIVFESANPDLITVANRPSKVTITKTSPENRPPLSVTVPGSDGDANDNDKNDGLSDGAIAGIVIGAIAAVGIAGFCVWFFVLRKGANGKVTNA